MALCAYACVWVNNIYGLLYDIFIDENYKFIDSSLSFSPAHTHMMLFRCMSQSVSSHTLK